MSITQEERAILVSLQLEKSQKHLLQADEMVKLRYYDMAANRYYYACFHALQALMINQGINCHTHAGLIGEFGKQFIKTGKIDAVYGRFISRLEQLREKGDYNCYYEIEEEDVKDMIAPAHDFVAMIQKEVSQ